MLTKKISGGTAHGVPRDFQKALGGSEEAFAVWEDITPLARNEWICWIESVAKKETRDAHVRRAIEDLTKGKRRPCCWMGCVHRKDKPMSASQRGLLGRSIKK